MESWLIVLISVGVPGTLTLSWRVTSAVLRARQTVRATDAEVAAGLRDELRGELDRLKAELVDVRERQRECEDDRDRMGREIHTLQAQVLQLQDRVRAGTSGPQVRHPMDEEGVA